MISSAVPAIHLVRLSPCPSSVPCEGSSRTVTRSRGIASRLIHRIGSPGCSSGFGFGSGFAPTGSPCRRARTLTGSGLGGLSGRKVYSFLRLPNRPHALSRWVQATGGATRRSAGEGLQPQAPAVDNHSYLQLEYAHLPGYRFER